MRQPFVCWVVEVRRVGDVFSPVPVMGGTYWVLIRYQPGNVRLFKLVDAALQSPIQATEKIQYAIGESLAVGDADTDESAQCSSGINVASLDWCLREWREGWRILIVEFTAADIAAIPVGSDGKIRLRRPAPAHRPAGPDDEGQGALHAADARQRREAAGCEVG